MIPTQTDIVLAKLKEGGCSNFWALRNYIGRLAARIYDLRKKGYKIEGHSIEGSKNYLYILIK